MKKKSYSVLAVLLCGMLTACGGGAAAPNVNSASGTVAKTDEQAEKDVDVVSDSASISEGDNNESETLEGKPDSADLSEDTGNGAPVSESAIVEPVVVEPEVIETVNSVEAMNTDEDTFPFFELCTKIGEDEAAVREWLSLPDESTEAEAVLFGVPINLRVEAADGICTMIQLAFRDTETELLENALNEQMGADGEEKEDAVSWSAEGCHVLLYDSGEGSYVDIVRG